MGIIIEPTAWGYREDDMTYYMPDLLHVLDVLLHIWYIK